MVVCVVLQPWDRAFPLKEWAEQLFCDSEWLLPQDVLLCICAVIGAFMPAIRPDDSDQQPSLHLADIACCVGGVAQHGCTVLAH